jgi:hypothetical protein
MQWDCKKKGCFNEHKRLKFERFSGCFPGRISFTDIDGIVEVNGNLLVLEWKEHRHVSRGQHLLFTRWTANGPATVIMVVGDARTMTVDEIAFVYKGVVGPWQDADFEDVCQHIHDWDKWARANPAKPAKE